MTIISSVYCCKTFPELAAHGDDATVGADSMEGVPIDPPEISGKNPAMRLNELRKGLVYDLVSDHIIKI